MLDHVSKKSFFSTSTDRDYSVDIVRCISCFMVIAGHTFWFMSPSSGLCPMEPGTFEHYMSIFLRCTFTCGTDIFLMISGVFFLAPERNLKTRKLWGKNILKMACAYVLWMFLYSLEDKLYAGEPFTFYDVLHHAVHQDQHHLWYIPMMLGIYMIVPLVRVFAEYAKPFHYKYLFIIMGVVSVLNLFSAICNVFTFPGADEFAIIISRMPVVLFSNYFMLSILGHWFYTYRLNKRARVVIYVLGIIGIFSMFICCSVRYDLQGVTDSPEFMAKFIFGNIFKCSAIFIFFTTLFDGVNPGKWGKKILSKLSGATLFIYLVHWMVVEFLLRHQFLISGVLENHLIIAGFVYVFIAYALGALFSFLVLQTIPWKKMRNAVLDAIWPNRTIYVTRKK